MNGAWRKSLFILAVMCLVGTLAYQSRLQKPTPLPLPSVDRKQADKLNSEVITQAQALPRVAERDGFVTSDQCRRCHEGEYASWHDSYHRTMTQVASPASVLAPFDNVRLASRGREYYLTREEDKFFVTMADADWEAGAQANGLDLSKVDPPIVKRQVVMTTGSHHTQGYWIPSSVPNMLREIPFAYLINDKRWVPREDLFIAPPDAPRHLAVWNDNCLVCHAVAGNPNFDLHNIKVASEVAELGISCEACHGPGKSHIAFHDQKLAAAGQPDPVINPATCEPRVSAEICGQCHSYFEPHDMQAFAKTGYTYRAGGDLNASHKLVSYAEAKAQNNLTAMASYWSDGTGRMAGREFSAMRESACYQRGPMSCISCHSSHSSDPDDQLAKDMLSNKACLQCHSKYEADLPAHTHHAADSAGSQCYNCHMPHTSFGLRKAIRSHRVLSPRVVHKSESDRPNACNLCHLDQSVAWAADKLNQWYGQPVASLDEDEKSVAAGVLWMTKGDAVQRAVATWHAGWQPAREAAGDQWQEPILAQQLVDDYAVVRYVAGKILTEQAVLAEKQFDYVGPLEERAKLQSQVQRAWVEKAKSTADSDEARSRRLRLLQDPQTGQLDRGKLEQLLKAQDRRPVFLPE